MNSKLLKFKVHAENFLLTVFTKVSALLVYGFIMVFLLTMLVNEKYDFGDWRWVGSSFVFIVIIALMSRLFYNNLKQLLIFLYGEIIVNFREDEIQIDEVFNDLKNTRLVNVKEIKEIVYFSDSYVIRQFDFNTNEIFIKRNYEFDLELLKATNLTVQSSKSFPIE